jgi:hypothetical protein
MKSLSEGRAQMKSWPSFLCAAERPFKWMSFIYEIARFLRIMPSPPSPSPFSTSIKSKAFLLYTGYISGCEEEKQRREGHKNIETLFHLLTSLFLHYTDQGGRIRRSCRGGRGRFLCEWISPLNTPSWASPTCFTLLLQRAKLALRVEMVSVNK